MGYTDVTSDIVEQDSEIDLKEMFSLFISNVWIIIMGGVVFGFLAFLISEYAMTPIYESSTQIYVMDKEDDTSISYSDIQLGSQLTNDFMTLIKSRPVTETVIENLGLNLNSRELAERISVSNPNNTRILTITVKSSNPMNAKTIVDEVRDAAAKQIERVMGIEKVNVVEEGNIPGGPSSPNVITNTLIGIILGVFLAVFLIFLKYALDDNIKKPEDIEKYLGLSVLTVIPKQKNKYNKSTRIKK